MAQIQHTAGLTTAGRVQIGPLMIGSEVYRGSSYGSQHPLRVPRVSTVLDLCRALDWLPPAHYRSSPRAKAAALTAWHTPAYIAALQTAEAAGQIKDSLRARHQIGTLSNPIFAQMFSRPATGAGGVLLAAELLAGAASGAVHVPGGGTHHGMPDHANGFCYLNDPVLGILALRRAGLRVAYVDIDAHHADGVEHAFANTPEVLLISVHEEARWPFTGALTDAGCGNVFNLPVPRSYNDTEARAVLEGLILPRVAGHRADVVVLQAGADSLTEDPLSRLCLSSNAYRAALAGLRLLAPRLLLLGGGGYNPWSVGRLWTLLWADLAGYPVPEVLPAPAQAVLRALDWGGGGRAAPTEALLCTLTDPPREGMVRDQIKVSLATLAAR